MQQCTKGFRAVSALHINAILASIMRLFLILFGPIKNPKTVLDAQKAIAEQGEPYLHIHSMSAVLDAYTAAELERFQYSNLESALPSNLNNAIHPIYSRWKWAKCTDEAYELLTPSLRLATLMITSRPSLIFYDSLMLKHRRLLNADTARLGKNCYHLRAFDSEDRDYADGQILRDVSENIAALSPHITCKLIPNVATETNYLAITRRVLSVIVKSDTGWPVGTGSSIDVGMEFVTNLRRVRAEGSISQLLRLQFSIAVTFAHELVHAVEHAVSLENYEPFFEDDRVAELGLAWEQAIFGGRVVALGDIDARNPLGLIKWPTAWPEEHPEIRLERRRPKKTSTVYFVPMTFIANTQRQAFWANMGDGDSDRLRISKRHGRQLTPGRPPFDPTWASEDSSEGRHPGDARGRVMRDDLHDDWEEVDEAAGGAQEWDDFGMQLRSWDSDDENFQLTRSMIEDFERGLEEMDLDI